MKSKVIAQLSLLLLVALTPVLGFSQNDWSRWRGPDGNGIANSQKPPVEWSADENVKWKTKVPGRGHASPIVLGDKIFLATAEDDIQTQSVLCFKRSNGKFLWKTKISEGGFSRRIHPKNTHASSTIATDGKYVFATFSHDASVHVTALDLDGKISWSKKVGAHEPAYPFGYGSSPIVHDGMVIVTNESQADSAVVAFDCESGKQRWKIDRKGVTSYSTPVVTTIDGKQRLLLSGGQRVACYDPANGKEVWSTDAQWIVTCGTIVWDENMVFASGGYPNAQTIGVQASSGKKIWDNPAKAYEQSMLATNGYVYAHCDNGVIYCWRAKDGTEMWKQRFSGRRVPISASPVLANGNIYFTAENGETVVIRATHEGFEEVARNKLGDETFASQAFCGNQIYTRLAMNDGNGRQEWLYCLGEK